jgi:outer membrane immunogenic protein
VASGASLGSHTAEGWVAGGQVGCDYQTGPWVFGIRGMFDWANMTGSHTDLASATIYNTRVKSFETAVGRVGYTLMPNTLVYALGGFAWVQDRHTLTTLDGVETGFANVTRHGYAVGGGLEHMFAPGWSAFIEYDYLHYGCVIPFTPVPNAPITPPSEINIEQSVSMVLVGVNYHFSIR